MRLLDIQKVPGYSHIYQAECFSAEVDSLFGKNTGEKKRYLRWLHTWLPVLDTLGTAALTLQQFEYLQNTENPRLYAIRHPHSQINERYIYVFVDERIVILLTAFKEQNTNDYEAAIARASRIYSELEGEQ